jgi:hypothetical protein
LLKTDQLAAAGVLKGEFCLRRCGAERIKSRLDNAAGEKIKECCVLGRVSLIWASPFGGHALIDEEKVTCAACGLKINGRLADDRDADEYVF